MKSIQHLGWQTTEHCVIGHNCQYDVHGEMIAPEDYQWTLIPRHLPDTPMPQLCEPDDSCVKELYCELKLLLPDEAYLACILVAGRKLKQLSVFKVQVQCTKDSLNIFLF